MDEVSEPDTPRPCVSVPGFLVELARSCGVRIVYDIGSRDAIDGLYLAEGIPASELHVFECNPPAIQRCEQTIAASAYPGRVVLCRAAVGRQSGETEFFAIDPAETLTTWPDGNIGASSLYRANPDYGPERYAQTSIRVPCVRLDEYTADHTAPDLLWMDVQGAELDVLRGAEAVLVAFRPVYLGQPLFREIHSYLRGRGFTLVRLSGIPAWMRYLHLDRALPMVRRGAWFGDATYVRRGARGQ
jgi:FkbM family methyltransferase